MIFDIHYFINVIPTITKALNITLSLALIASACSLAIGALVAVITYYRVKVLTQICACYVSIFRGTPLLPQIFFLYFGLAYVSEFVRGMSPLVATAVVLSLNMGAYMSENIRAAMLSVDEGQKEAAYSLGMTNAQLMCRIIAPQALRVALPSLFNNFIDIIKGTSVAFVVGVPDIMGVAKTQGALSFRYFEIYAAVMVVYWVIITILTFFQRRLEVMCAKAY